MVSDVTDVPVSPSSVVTGFYNGFSCSSDWEDVEHCCTSTQEEMRYGCSQVKAPPLSRGRMMPPTPLQNSNDTFDEEQGRFVVEDQMWSARERTIIARTKQYLEESYSVKVEVAGLQDLLGPDDVDVDFKRILKEARDEKVCATFETFSTDGLSDFLVASRSRWDKYKKTGTHGGDKIRRPLQEKVGGKRAWNSREVDGARWKKGLWRQWKITWRIAPT